MTDKEHSGRPFTTFWYFAKIESYRHLEIDEPIAAIIRMLFNEILAGKTKCKKLLTLSKSVI